LFCADFLVPVNFVIISEPQGVVSNDITGSSISRDNNAPDESSICCEPDEDESDSKLIDFQNSAAPRIYILH
jgi:hypothetical protein